MARADNVAVQVRFTPAEAERIDALRRRAGQTRAGLLRSIINAVLDDDEAAHGGALVMGWLALAFAAVVIALFVAAFIRALGREIADHEGRQ